MLRRVLIVPILISVALTTVGVSLPMAAFAKDGGGGDGGGRGGGDGGRGGSDEGGRGDNGGRGGGDDGSRGGRGGQDDGIRGDRGPDQADEGGHGRGRGRNSDARALPDARWGSSSPDRARQAVSQGWVLGLSAVLPTVSRAVPGQVLEVDLRQSWTGDWRYEFLVLARDRTYQEIVVDARRNQILQVRRR